MTAARPARSSGSTCKPSSPTSPPPTKTQPPSARSREGSGASLFRRLLHRRVGARRRHRDQLLARKDQRGQLAAVDAAGVEAGREGVLLQPADGVVPEDDVLRTVPEGGPGGAVDPLRGLAL